MSSVGRELHMALFHRLGIHCVAQTPRISLETDSSFDSITRRNSVFVFMYADSMNLFPEQFYFVR